jgi:hypothetical protein
MTVQRISLVPDSEKDYLIIKQKILDQQLTKKDYDQLPPAEQQVVEKALFDIASDKVEPNIGASALEFVLFMFMRIVNKKLVGKSLTADDKIIEASLNRITSMHQITDSKLSIDQWLFDYMAYAEEKAAKILQNRKEHIARKVEITGHH